MTGVDISIPELTLTVHQPKIKEIAMMGEETYYLASQLLCSDKSLYIKDKSMSEQITNFQIFMRLIEEKGLANSEDIKSTINNLFSLLF